MNQMVLALGLAHSQQAMQAERAVTDMTNDLLKMCIRDSIASVALTGSVLLVQGSIDVLTLFLFLMAASRMYVSHLF